MHPWSDQWYFGDIGKCSSVTEVATILETTPGEAQRAAVAAYGMALAAISANRGGRYREDALEALNALARAKAEIDIAALHLRPVVTTTSGILLEAQCFVDKATIPCTEWPTPAEIAELVCREAQQYALSKR